MNRDFCQHHIWGEKSPFMPCDHVQCSKLILTALNFRVVICCDTVRYTDTGSVWILDGFQERKCRSFHNLTWGCSSGSRMWASSKGRWRCRVAASWRTHVSKEVTTVSSSGTLMSSEVSSLSISSTGSSRNSWPPTTSKKWSWWRERVKQSHGWNHCKSREVRTGFCFKEWGWMNNVLHKTAGNEKVGKKTMGRCRVEEEIKGWSEARKEERMWEMEDWERSERDGWESLEKKGWYESVAYHEEWLFEKQRKCLYCLIC